LAIVAILIACLLSCTAPEPLPPSTINRSAPQLFSADELYAEAVTQYRQLFEIIKQVNAQDGAPQLPESVRDFLVEPAWGAFNHVYSEMYYWGDHYIGLPDFQITAIAPLDPAEETFDAVVAIQSCETILGALFVEREGYVLWDGSPVVQHIKSYFRIEEQALKVFISNSEVVDSCPIV